ncbi:MAG: beta-glucosidase BglX [Bacteroidaceae bacterium]|nr:beta-glucosidase BglX [Bacteroidaceae bacterium]
MRQLKLMATTLVLASLLSCGKKAGEQTRDSIIETKVEQLLSKMTLEEKIGQMNQISSSIKLEEMGPAIKRGEVGSILNEAEPQRINALQNIAVEESRLGIPLLIARDVIHGFKTIFPIPLGQGASFDPDVAYQGARVAAVEAASVGIRWTFAPMIDIARDPRWGRISEGCGEDSYLTSVMGAAMVRGFQGDSLHLASSIAACPKHFVGYGAVEGGRDYNSTYIPERLMRNVYLPPFKAAVEAGATTFMTSFNDNNGIPSSGNQLILKKILREEWGFKGFVVTDWGSAQEMITHGFAVNDKDAAEKAVNAGVDMEMVSHMFVEQLPQLVKEGAVSETTIDNAVRNILRVKFQLGLFENPYVDTTKPSVMYDEAHLLAAKRAAIESAILLKNKNNTLPLSNKIKTIAVVGPMADAPYEQLGTWVFDGEKSHTQTPLAALKKIAKERNMRVLYEPGLAYTRDKSTQQFRKVTNAAKRADAVIVFVGEESILSGEAHSLANLDLQGAQTALIEALKRTGKPLITVVMAGRPLTIEKEVNLSDAVLYSFHPGTMGGPALADLLTGVATPSGKTPITFPKMVGQIPMYYSHKNTGRPATRNETLLDQIPVAAGQTSLGCTSFYLDAGFDPLFPFGYGLSYTTFAYSNILLSATKLQKKDVLTVTFDLKNTGDYKGTEVAQLYIQDKVGSVTRPVKELKRFKRIHLLPGQTEKVTFELPISELAFCNIDMKEVVEAGQFGLWVATDSNSGKELSFEVVR